jgi:hypothetical protein
MNNEKEIKTAWMIWQLLIRLSELLWDQYEKEFTARYLELDEEKFWQSQSDNDALENT